MSQTILIVDDLTSVRLYHSSFLTRRGYTCIGANDGADALARLGESRVDLVILDIMMPGMNGETFIQQLSANPAWSGLPILVITSERQLADSLLKHNTRPIDVLTKPVAPEKLIQGLHRLLPPASGN